MGHVLIVDDEPTICWGFRELLTDDGHRVSIAPSAEDGMKIVADDQPDAIVLDVRLPGMDGITAIEKFRQTVGEVPIIVVTAFGNLETAVKAVEAGAYDYLTKPFELQDAAELLDRALHHRADAGAIQRSLETELIGPIIGTSAAMQAVFKQIALAAPRDVPVLVTGESGTGKELVAEAIHRHSPRRKGPYVPICLAALSANVIESELFGHRRGAFAGAERDQVGMLQLAAGGTVLLDELGDVPLPLQVKLLRAIERREVTPVGDPQPQCSDFRVVAATNRALGEMVQQGEFREDLYYRLSVFPIEIPPLRDRREDIPVLAEHFLEQTARHDSHSHFSTAAMKELCARPWYGNVRELRNAVERAAIVACGRRIEPEHLPAPAPRHSRGGLSISSSLQMQTQAWLESEVQPDDESEGHLYERFLNVVEPALFAAVLRQCDNNQAAAARRLGIHRATLREKLRRYGLKDGLQRRGDPGERGA